MPYLGHKPALPMKASKRRYSPVVKDFWEEFAERCGHPRKRRRVYLREQRPEEAEKIFTLSPNDPVLHLERLMK